MPDGWAWCRLGEISSELGDGIHGTPEYDVNGDYYFVNGNNLCNGKIIIKDDTKRVSQIEYNKYKKNLNQNTILVSINGTLGNIAFYNKENIILGKSACYFNLFEKQFKDFMFFLLSSEYFKKYASENATGSTIKNVSLKTMRDFLVPLPTLNEQKKIVSAIKTIFNQITIIENDKTDLQEIIKQTKSKILDLAIHGKLVPQDPNDEPAEELLKRIATSDNRPYKKFEEDEVPFIIPFNWKWERLAKISSIISKGTTPRGGKNAYCIEGINYLRVENISADGTINLEDINHISENEHLTFLKRSILQENDVIISIAGTLGKIGIIRKCDLPMNTNQAIAFVRISNLSIINLKYLRYVLESVELQRLLLSQTKVTSIPNLTLEIINNCPIPLPPIQEQNRIVSKIEELFSDLDSISSNLE